VFEISLELAMDISGKISGKFPDIGALYPSISGNFPDIPGYFPSPACMLDDSSKPTMGGHRPGRYYYCRRAMMMDVSGRAHGLRPTASCCCCCCG